MSPKNNRRKKKTAGAKYMIASASIALAIIVWATLSTRDQVADVMAASDEAVDMGNSSQNIELVLDPLPTLIPLQFPDEDELIANQEEESQSAELRSVSAPEQKVQQVGGSPMIVSRNSGGGGSSGGGGGGGGSVTTTSSS